MADLPVLTDQMRAVVVVAETMYDHRRHRWWRRRLTRFDFVPIAREVVAALISAGYIDADPTPQTKRPPALPREERERRRDPFLKPADPTPQTDDKDDQ